MSSVVDRITVEARQIHLGRAALTAVAAVLYGLGWLAAKAVIAVVLAAVWCAAAVRVGWADARRSDGRR